MSVSLCDVFDSRNTFFFGLVCKHGTKCAVTNDTNVWNLGAVFLVDDETATVVGFDTDGFEVEICGIWLTTDCYENDVCKIDYIDKSVDLKDTQPPLFGAQLYFGLDKVVNCPEYLAYFPLLKHMLNELDMELIYEERFCDAYKRYLDSHEGKQLMHRMKAAETFSMRDRSNSGNDEKEYKHASDFLEENFSGKLYEKVGTISASEWEVISMYLLFAFQKRDSPSTRLASDNGDEKSPRRSPS